MTYSTSGRDSALYGVMTRMDDAENSAQEETTQEQLAELDRRLAELDEHPEAGESWDTVRARILDSL